MLKKSLIIALASITTAAFAYTYDLNLPLAGNTETSQELQKEMLFPVYSYGLRVATPDCKELKISDTEVSKAKENGEWEEIWTLNACTTTARIPIKFTEVEDKVEFAIDAINVKVAR